MEMEGSASVLEDMFQAQTLDDDDDGGIKEEEKEDVEMFAAETLESGGDGGLAVGPAGGGAPQAEGGSGIKSRGRRGCRGRGKKKNRCKRKGSGASDGSAASSVADINRFVIGTCRHLKEHKSYLLWNAVGCLGVSVVKDLVKEVDAIQRCGGQKTADGRRFRTGGGILWNILKTREPKAYKEIMAKGKEFEKQFKEAKAKMRSSNEGALMSSNVPCEAAEVLNSSEHDANVQEKLESSDPKTQHQKVMDRIRVPVSYEDLLEEGEIR